MTSTITRWALYGESWYSPGLDPVAATAAGDGYAPQPTAQNTGPAAGVTLDAVSGDVTLTTDGQTYSGKHVSGSIFIAADNVTVVDCQVDVSVNVNQRPGGNYDYPVHTGITVQRVLSKYIGCLGAVSLTIDACHLTGNTSTACQLQDLTSGGHTYALTDLTITNSLFDGLVASTGDKHTEAIHIFNCDTALIQNNVFDWYGPDSATRSQITAAVTFENGGNTNITFDHNRLANGGVYQLYWNPTDSTLTNNVFDLSGGQTLAYPYSSPNAFTQSGNTLADGTPVTVSNGSVS